MNCQIQDFLHLLGQKWTVLVLFEFCATPEKSIRYSELERALPGITPKILSQRLHQLLDEGLLEKSVEREELPRSVSYTFTAKGKTLIPVIVAVREWTTEHTACTERETCDRCQF